MNGNLLLMRTAWVLGVDVNKSGCKYRSCLTPITGAAFGGNEESVLFLLDQGADINQASNGGGTPLMYAAFNGDAAIVGLLIEKGADVNLRSDDDSALSFAKERDHREVVKILRQAGASEAR
jgi:ankyrin repeat protein